MSANKDSLNIIEQSESQQTNEQKPVPKLCTKISGRDSISTTQISEIQFEYDISQESLMMAENMFIVKEIKNINLNKRNQKLSKSKEQWLLYISIPSPQYWYESI